MRRVDGRFEFSDRGNRWILIASSRVSTLDPAMRSNVVDAQVMARRIAEWRADPTIWPNLLCLHDELIGARFGPVTLAEIDDSIIPSLLRLFKTGRAIGIQAGSTKTRGRDHEEAFKR